MINPNAKLNPDIFDASKLEQKATRDGFGVGLVAAGTADVNVVGLTADLSESTRMDGFQKTFPDRFIEVGVAEQNMITLASGLANYGKVPFATSYASFSPGRNWEQIRTTIALNNVPVKIVGCHAGLTVGPDGATHQMLEDIALMRSMPNMIVIVPADANEANRATLAIAKNGKPTYLRLGREKTPVFTTNDTPFEIGKAITVYENNSPDVGIVACGNMVYPAMVAAQELGNEGINATVINLHTIKPIDRDAIVNLAKSAGAIVTAEEHQIMGGMGSAVAEVLAEEHPVPMEFVGMRDAFGQSGKPDELMKHYKLDVEGIMVACRDAVRRK
jgi:transketolase